MRNEAAPAFAGGDEVEFEGRRDQGTVRGVVVGRAGAHVKVQALRYSLFGTPGPTEVWRVAPSVLRKVGGVPPAAQPIEGLRPGRGLTMRDPVEEEGNGGEKKGFGPAPGAPGGNPAGCLVEGGRMWNVAPYGFRFAPGGRVIPDPTEQGTLAHIATLRAAGTSLRNISAILAAQGLLARTGRPFAPVTLARLVRRIERDRAEGETAEPMT